MDPLIIPVIAIGGFSLTFIVGVVAALASYGIALFLLGGISMRRGELPALSV